MAHFYGVLQGRTNKSVATRTGHKTTGIETHAASWQGQVHVRLWYDEKRGLDMALVELAPWHGVGTSEVLYDGPVGGNTINLQSKAWDGVERGITPEQE